MARSKGWSLPVLFLLLIVSSSNAPAEEPYEEIRVHLPSDTGLKTLLRIPSVELIGMGDGDVRLLSRPSTTKELIARGWAVDILHPDLESFYASRQAPAGDYGVWHTFAEMVAELELLHSQYPSLTSAPFSIGRSVEGRDIWAIKVSDDPAVDEGATEPQVLFDGVHHAREIMTVEMNLFFARYLCEQYGADSLVTRLVNEREVFFVPIVNPDGFVYNETLNPNGGGMWRKNRRRNGSRCDGVDLNRNYPFMWGREGSSDDPCDETYHGTAPGSEPENQAMMAFINARRFVTSDSYHSVAGMILFPWGYTPEPTPDDAVLREIAARRASENGYTIGQSPEILYIVSGGFTDWAYGEQDTKPKIFSFSTEIGGSGFWPAPEEREPLLLENLHSMLFLTQVAGPSVTVEALVADTAEAGDGRIDPGATAELVATLRNEGLVAGARDLHLHLRCDDPYIVMLDASSRVGTLAPGQDYTNTADPFRIRADGDCPPGRRVTFTVVADGASSVHAEAPVLMRIGRIPAIYADDFEDPGDEWLPDESQTATTGSFVRIDPNPTEFQPGDDATPVPGIFAWVTGQNTDVGIDDVDGGIAACHSPDFDLSLYPRVWMSVDYFHGQRDGGDDPTGDFFKIDVSSNGGVSWVNLLTIPDQISTPEWRNLTVDLRDFIALTDRVRVRVQASDGPAENDIVEGGIDDFLLSEDLGGDQPPGVPVVVSPPAGATDLSSRITLTVGNASDPEADPLRYGFRIFADRDLTELVAAADGVREGAGTTSWAPDSSLALGTYYWRAYAADPTQRGLYTPTVSFTVTHPDEGLAASAPVVRVGPNPAPAGILIRYFVPATTTSRLAIYDPQGRLVRRFQTAPSASGWGEITWDGKDDADRPIASGSYWVRLWTPQETRTVRVVRIR